MTEIGNKGYWSQTKFETKTFKISFLDSSFFCNPLLLLLNLALSLGISATDTAETTHRELLMYYILSDKNLFFFSFSLSGFCLTGHPSPQMIPKFKPYFYLCSLLKESVR